MLKITFHCPMTTNQLHFKEAKSYYPKESENVPILRQARKKRSLELRDQGTNTQVSTMVLFHKVGLHS